MLFIKDAESVADIRFCAEKINRILVKTYKDVGKEVTVSASIGHCPLWKKELRLKAFMKGLTERFMR